MLSVVDARRASYPYYYLSEPDEDLDFHEFVHVFSAANESLSIPAL